jgi:hypothetical protein
MPLSAVFGFVYGSCGDSVYCGMDRIAGYPERAHWMNVEGRFNRSANLGSCQPDPPPPSHLDNNIHNHPRHPGDPSSSGTLPLSNDRTIQGADTWDRSPQGHLSPLRNHPVPSSRKRKRMGSPEPSTAGVHRPSSDGTLDGESSQTNKVSSPTVNFTERKKTAYDVWVFTRAIDTSEAILPEQWPDDYDQRLTKRPDSSFVGCKFCTQFG